MRKKARKRGAAHPPRNRGCHHQGLPKARFSGTSPTFSPSGEIYQHLFRAMDHALESGETESLHSVVTGIVDLAKDSPSGCGRRSLEVTSRL